MCKEDKRLAAKMYTRVTYKALNDGVGVALVGEARNRVHLRISIDSSTCQVLPTTDDNGSLRGFMLNITKPDFQLDIEQHGNIVTFPWSGIGAGGSNIATIMETFLDSEEYK